MSLAKASDFERTLEANKRWCDSSDGITDTWLVESVVKIVCFCLPLGEGREERVCLCMCGVCTAVMR